MSSFVPIYGLSTPLTAATAAGAGQLQIDNSVANYIAAALVGGNFTYVALDDGVNYEIIRIDSVSAPYLNITRGLGGTTSSNFPIGTCLKFVWITEGIRDAVAAISFGITGTGAVTVTQTGPDSFNIDVPATTITASLPIEVLGSFPNYDLGFVGSYGGCCCSGGSGGGGTVNSVHVTGTGLAVATSGGTSTDPTFNIQVVPPNFVGAGTVTVTGSWPNYTITGFPGTSGVASVTSGNAKIVIGGSGTNPTVLMATTGIGTVSLNGITYDNWGTVTAVDTSKVAVTTITSSNAAITVTGPAPTYSITANNATTSAHGVVQLAAATAGASRNAGDATSAVTPAGVDAVLNAFAVPHATTSTYGTVQLAAATATASNNASDATSAVTPAGINAVMATLSVTASSTFIADVPGNYTNTLGSTITTPVLVAGQQMLITASAEVDDSGIAPGNVPSWGLAIFNGATLVQGIKAMHTGSHFIQYTLAGPQAAMTLTLKTTTLTGTTSVNAQSIIATVV